MMKIELYKIDPQLVEEVFEGSSSAADLDIKYGSCFWVSSMAIDSQESVEEYLKYIDEGNLERLREFRSVGEDFLCTYLIRKKAENDAYILAAVQKGGFSPPKIVAIKEISNLYVAGMDVTELKDKPSGKIGLIELIKIFCKI